jgi:hypothetical protein
MKALNTNVRIIKGIFFVICLAALTFGCQKEVITPENDANIQGSSFHFIQRPPVQCGPSVFASMKDGSTNLGSVEILNNSTDLYLIFNMNQFKFVEEVKVFTGDINNVPTDFDGNMQIENFGFQQILTSPANDYTLLMPLSGLSSCSDIVVWARVTTRNMWGQVTATNYTWMSGTPVANGYMTGFCATACITGNSTAQGLVL